MKRFIVLSVIVLFFVANLTLAAEKKSIVVSTSQIADFTRQIVGDRMNVFCLLAPGVDPHTYKPTPKDVEMVTKADLCIENGMHLEGKSWMANLAKDSGKPLITATKGIRALKIVEGGEQISDPHAWFNPENVSLYVRNIVVGVVSLMPQYEEEFYIRAQFFLQQLRMLDRWIVEQVSSIPPEKRILVTSHDAFNYFCRKYKFNKSSNYLSIAPVGWSTGAEVGGGMTPARRTAVVQSIKRSGAAAIFVETSVNPKQMRSIARETGVVLGGSLYSDSMGVRGSAGESYIGMMRENVLTIITALQ